MRRSINGKKRRLSLSQCARTWLLCSGVMAFVGALIHLAIPVGGPAWYLYFGAPPGLAAMAEAGSIRPLVSCLVIALVLLVCSAYAFSGLRLIRRLPLLRLGLAGIGSALVVRGLAFVPLAIWSPNYLAGICGRCQGVNGFLVFTSAICVVAGVGFLLGAAQSASSPVVS